MSENFLDRFILFPGEDPNSRLKLLLIAKHKENISNISITLKDPESKTLDVSIALTEGSVIKFLFTPEMMENIKPHFNEGFHPILSTLHDLMDEFSTRTDLIPLLFHA